MDLVINFLNGHIMIEWWFYIISHLILLLMGEFTALFGKNQMLYERGCSGNIFQILIPIFFVVFVILVTYVSPPTLYVQQAFLPNIIYSQPVDFSSRLLSLMKKCKVNLVIALVQQTSTIVTKLNTILTPNSKTTQLFATEAALEAQIRSPSYSTSTAICWAVVVQEELQIQAQVQYQPIRDQKRWSTQHLVSHSECGDRH